MTDNVFYLGREMPTRGGSTDPADFDKDGVIDGKGPYLLPAIEYPTRTPIEIDESKVTVLLKKQGNANAIVIAKVRMYPEIVKIEEWSKLDKVYAPDGIEVLSWTGDVSEWTRHLYTSDVSASGGAITVRQTPFVDMLISPLPANTWFYSAANESLRVRSIDIEIVSFGGIGTGGQIEIIGETSQFFSKAGTKSINIDTNAPAIRITATDYFTIGKLEFKNVRAASATTTTTSSTTTTTTP